jgi:hypothetical protein
MNLNFYFDFELNSFSVSFLFPTRGPPVSTRPLLCSTPRARPLPTSVVPAPLPVEGPCLWVCRADREPIGGKWRQLVGKVGEWYVLSRHLQGCSPYLCRLRTDGLAPVSKYWMYRSHAGVYGPVSWSSCVTLGQFVFGCQDFFQV